MLRATELTCFHLAYAKGVDQKKVNFSWKNACDNNDHNQYQTAYQLVVTDVAENEIFDSGKVISNQQMNIYHILDAMCSSSIYTYQVRVWDQDGQASAFSEPARFITGILDPDEWTAHFIHAKSSTGLDLMNDTIWYRKEFTAIGRVSRAICHIGCIGHFELYLNGDKVDSRVLSPARSRVLGYKRTLYLTYDLSGMIKPGRNVIGLWCDAGWARNAQVEPAFICQMIFEDDRGQSTMISDQSWQCHQSCIRHIGKFEWADFGGEEISDSPLNPAWSTAAISAEDWLPVSRVKINTALSAELLDGDGIIECFKPRSIDRTDSAIVLDMGKNYTGWVEFKFTGGQAGSRLIIMTADKPTESITFNQVSTFVFSAAEGTFCNKFNYFSGRYITIAGDIAAIELTAATGLALSSLMKQTASFNCSDPLLNAIYQADLATFTANTLSGVTVDCPHRERLGYGETGISTIWGIGRHCFDSQAFYRNYFRNWRDTQEPDGYLPHVAPNFDGGGGTTWSSCLTIGLYDFYRYFGDQELLAENYTSVKKWAQFLLNHVQDGIMARYDRDSADFSFLGDWATFEGDDWGSSEQALFFNNCVAIFTLNITSIFAEMLGDEKFAGTLQTCCQDMRTVLHQKYYQPEQGFYLQGQQRYLATALCAGVVPDTEASVAAKNILLSFQRKQYLDGGSAGMIFILRALGDILKRRDPVYQWLRQTNCPGYGYFIQKDQNTWPEMWDMRDIYGGSRVHTCYTGIAGWFSRDLLGLRPADAGMQDISLTPFFPEDLQFVESDHDYGYGQLGIYWQRCADNLIRYALTVPVNTTIHLSAPQNYAIKTGNEMVPALSAGSGEYVFEFSVVCEPAVKSIG